jgi:hypothetical protein
LILVALVVAALTLRVDVAHWAHGAPARPAAGAPAPAADPSPPASSRGLPPLYRS